ncbi:hypothetical protein BJ878DRAFT_17631 [Calycina marina]|uniref:Anaphase-promoting complex subunit 2 n=1 Tax=Calycina marina TaxID=1763456 RepID=A0A9P8CKG3_9HELO|nr:hypothetical protein BJ878DRAFT_17631 [Calycina marina]
MATQILTARKRRVFNAVFKRPQISQPTPVATPATGFTAQGQAFGELPRLSQQARDDSFHELIIPSSPGLFHSVTGDESGHAQHQARWDRSWHTVTYDLALANIPADLDPMENSQITKILNHLTYDPKRFDTAYQQALLDVLDPQIRLPNASHREDVVLWHSGHVQNHFLHQVLPLIARITNIHGAEMYLYRVVRILTAAHEIYLDGLEHASRTDVGPRKKANKHPPRLCRDLHPIISNSLTNKIAIPLRGVLRNMINEVLGLPSKEGWHPQKKDDPSSEAARGELLKLIESLQDVGLSGESLQTILAEVMNDSMTLYVNIGYTGIWSEVSSQLSGHKERPDKRQPSLLPRTAHHSSASRCVRDLCEWIENRYAKLAVQVFSVLTPDTVGINWRLVEKWKEMGIARLANLRISELFDIVHQWPRSSGALEDLKTAITTPQRRLRLTEVFAADLSKRLLHPGTSTLQILQYYISMIASFHALDHSKVLLDRVAHPLQVYLYSREDTVRVIITGLLSDTEDAEGNPIGPGGDKLHELASLLDNNGSRQRSQIDDDLDWRDLDWTPDPVDAGPGYKRSKSADIVGTLIRALGTQEVFIKEFQSILAENLLRADYYFYREVKVLELLKSRYGDAPLQSCEVMIRDMIDSNKVDMIVRAGIEGKEMTAREAEVLLEKVPSNDDTDEVLPIHAKILSRLFWPQLQDESYRIPDDITQLQRRYEVGFEKLKASRKLTWMHALGQATVELDLADRIFTEEVLTWQATVIWEFQSDNAGEVGVQRNVQEIVDQLDMDESLVRSALKFWTTKIVLQEVEKDVYMVLERLNPEQRAWSNAMAAATNGTAPAEEVMEDTASIVTNGITKEKRQLYWQFIQGMLKNNSSQLPLMRIGMTLRMLLPDGFPLSNEELQEFLGTFVAEGALAFAAGKYKLAK